METASPSSSKNRASGHVKSPRLTRRQKWILAILGFGNLLLVFLLALLILGSPALPGPSATPSPTAGRLVAVDRQNVCRGRVSQALLKAGLVGTVFARPDGVLSVSVVRHSGFDCDAHSCSEPVRALAFGGIWIVLEALGSIHTDSCDSFDVLDLTVAVRTASEMSFQAHVHVLLPDLALWANNAIDDDELSSRLIFQTLVVSTPRPTLPH